VTDHALHRSMTAEKVVVNAPRALVTGRRTVVPPSSSATRTRALGLNPVPRTVTGLRVVRVSDARA
jgi:hypothetical protein